MMRMEGVSLKIRLSFVSGLFTNPDDSYKINRTVESLFLAPDFEGAGRSHLRRSNHGLQEDFVSLCPLLGLPLSIPGLFPG